MMPAAEAPLSRLTTRLDSPGKFSYRSHELVYCFFTRFTYSYILGAGPVGASPNRLDSLEPLDFLEFIHNFIYRPLMVSVKFIELL